MQTQIQARSFELHPAQKFVVDRGLAKVGRLLKHVPSELLLANVVISCHHTPDPVFTSHLYLEMPSQKITSSATNRKFAIAFNESLNKLMRQLRKRKTALLQSREKMDAFKSA